MLIWYHFGGHLLRGYNGKAAIHEAITFDNFAAKFMTMMSGINNEIFAGLMILFVIIVFVMVVIRAQKKELRYSFDIMLICCAFLHTVVICKIVPVDYHSEGKSEFCESLKDKDCLVMITEPWESFYFFVLLPKARSYSFITPDMLEEALKHYDNGYVIATTSNKKDLWERVF